MRPLVLLKRSVVACTVGFYDRLTFVGLNQIWCSQAVQHFGCSVMFSISDDPSILGGQPADIERGFMRSNASWRWKGVYLGLYHSSPFSISLSSTIIIDHYHRCTYTLVIILTILQRSMYSKWSGLWRIILIVISVWREGLGMKCFHRKRVPKTVSFCTCFTSLTPRTK